jgi:hypothetical protein
VNLDKNFVYLFLFSEHNKMQKIGNNTVYITIEENLDPCHTALVAWDVQRAFTKARKIGLNICPGV